MTAPLRDFYSRVSVASLIKETTPNTPLTPTNFFELNEENLTVLYDREPSQPVAGNRALNIRPISKAIAAPAGTITMNVEPKQLGHFLNGLFGGLTSGRYAPLNTITGTGFVVGETVTQATTGYTATVSAVMNNGTVILLTSPTGAFNTTNIITGGTSATTAKITTYDASVYGYYGKLPAEIGTGHTYTLQFNYADSAIRYMGVRFHALDTLAQANNIMTAGFKVFAQGAFRHAKVTAVTTAGGSKTITVDQTYGLVTGDTCKLYRPGTGFMDFSASNVKTSAITVVSTTTFTVANLQVDTAVGDLIELAPQTATYTVGNNFAWIGGTTASIGNSLATLATYPLEDFTMVIENAFEERHAAQGTLLANLFPAAVLQKGLITKGTFKTWYQNEELVSKTRTNTAQALQISTQGDQIGTTGMYNTLQITFPSVQFQPIQTNISADAIIDNAVSFDGYYNSTSGLEVYCLYITDVTSF